MGECDRNKRNTSGRERAGRGETMSPGVFGAPGELTANDGDPEFPIRATSPAWKRALYWHDGENVRGQPEIQEHATSLRSFPAKARDAAALARRGRNRPGGGQSPGVAGGGRCSPAPAAAPGTPSPAPARGSAIPNAPPSRARGTLTRAGADSAMAASRPSTAGPHLIPLGLRAGPLGTLGPSAKRPPAPC